MEESRLRTSLGTLIMISSVVIGYMESSFLWGIGAFLGLNLITAPIITLIEKREIKNLGWKIFFLIILTFTLAVLFTAIYRANITNQISFTEQSSSIPIFESETNRKLPTKSILEKKPVLMDENIVGRIYDNVPSLKKGGTRIEFIKAMRDTSTRRKIYNRSSALQEIGTLNGFLNVGFKVNYNKETKEN